MIREKSAGVITYRIHPKEGLQYLLLYLKESYWNFSKGHVEEGESEMEAAVRELEEETGLKNITLAPDWRQQTHFFFRQQRDGVSELIKKDFVLYLAQVPADSHVDITDKVSKHEVINGYAWMDYKNACKYLKFKNLKEILTEADSYIRTIAK
ncbi:MAG: NUDIX domain-containing protein [Candidatus Buchananbacteria bacterium]